MQSTKYTVKTAENRLKATLKPKKIITANITKFHASTKII